MFLLAPNLCLQPVELVAVDLAFVLRGLDGMEGSPFIDQIDRWGGGQGALVQPRRGAMGPL